MLSYIINFKLFPIWKLGKAFRRVLTAFSVCMTLSISTANVAQADENTWLYYSGHPEDFGSTRLTVFVDPFSLERFDIFKSQITILTEFTGGMQSAMTFGESEVSEVMFDCQKSQMKNSSVTWYEKTQAKGQVTKVFIDLPWHPIEISMIKLFADMCG